jgi:hypothetical protein
LPILSTSLLKEILTFGSKMLKEKDCLKDQDINRKQILKTNFNEIGWKSAKSIPLAQDRTPTREGIL